VSKAFVNEDAPTPDDAAPLPRRPAAPLPITPRGRDELRRELEGLDPGGRRALEIAQILATVAVREPGLEDGAAGFGSVIEVERASGARRAYELVGPDEADPRAGRISIASPLAQALLGRRAGDRLTVRTPTGDEAIAVLATRLPGG